MRMEKEGKRRGGRGGDVDAAAEGEEETEGRGSCGGNVTVREIG